MENLHELRYHFKDVSKYKIDYSKDYQSHILNLHDLTSLRQKDVETKYEYKEPVGFGEPDEKEEYINTYKKVNPEKKDKQKQVIDLMSNIQTVDFGVDNPNSKRFEENYNY